MLKLEIPGREPIELEHLVLDYNGTIALDGKIVPGVIERLVKISRNLNIHILTADTHGSAKEQLSNTGFNLHIIGKNKQDREKLAFIDKLGKEKCVCFGNGANDYLMLKNAALGIAVIQKEGAYSKIIFNSKIVVTDIRDGLDLILNPLRLVATLRI